MVYIDTVEVTPNPVDAGKAVTVKISVHEEYEKAKKYENKYPYRYGEKK